MTLRPGPNLLVYTLVAVQLLLLFCTSSIFATGKSDDLSTNSTHEDSGRPRNVIPTRSAHLLVLGNPDTPGLAEHVERMNNPPAYLKWGNLGAQYLKAKQYDKALEAYREELRLTQGSLFEGIPQEMIIRVHEAKGDYLDAARELEANIRRLDAERSNEPDHTYWSEYRPQDVERVHMYQAAAQGNYDVAIQHAHNLQKAELQTFHARKYPSRRQEILDEWQPRIQALEERARAAGQVTAASQKNIVPE